MLTKNKKFEYKITRQSRLDGLDDELNERKVINDLDNIFNGVTKSGDISSVSVIKSIINQLLDIDELSFYVSDVYPKTMVHLFNSLIIPLMRVVPDGFSVIRLPDAHTWDDYDTMIVNFFLLVISQFDVVKVFRTPWGTKARYYLIITGKRTFTAANYTNLLKYNERSCIKNIPLFSKKLDVSPLINFFNQLQNNLLDSYEYLEPADANTIFIDTMTNVDDAPTDDAPTDDAPTDDDTSTPS
jgi:hypothetical protein